MVQRIADMKISTGSQNFNTSYVMVQRCKIYHGINLFSISIHLMLWFNIKDKISDNSLILDFNTSYVMVQPLLVCDCYFLLY